MVRAQPITFLTAIGILCVFEFAWGLEAIPPFMLAMAGAGLVASGLPHGALDILISRNARFWDDIWSFATFHGVYVAAAASAFAAFFIAPTVALVIFFILSIIHFADDWDPELPLVVRLALAMATLVVPILAHPNEALSIFSLLTGNVIETPPGASTNALQYFVPAGVGIIAATATLRPKATIPLLGVLVGATVLPPLVFFGAYFALWHSVGHLKRHLSAIDGLRHWLVLALYSILVTGAIVLIALVAPLPIQNMSLSDHIVQGLFWVLASLTVPHMILLWLAECRASKSPAAK